MRIEWQCYAIKQGLLFVSMQNKFKNAVVKLLSVGKKNEWKTKKYIS